MKTDAQLHQDIMQALNWEPSLNPIHIDVAVRDGVVTLTGFVTSLTEKWTTEHVVKSVAGVKAVADDLEVRLPTENERTDSDIARAAVTALEWNTSVPHDRLTVTVRNGWVTLDGSVDWPYQKTAAEEAVRPLMGVKGVTNTLVVQPKVEATDISAKIAVYRLVNRITAAGKSVILISSDHDELVALSDRIGIMSHGRLTRVSEAGALGKIDFVRASAGAPAGPEAVSP